MLITHQLPPDRIITTSYNPYTKTLTRAIDSKIYIVKLRYDTIDHLNKLTLLEDDIFKALAEVQGDTN